MSVEESNHKKSRFDVNEDKPLSKLALRFIDEYVAKPIGSEAVIRAGYSPANADKKAYMLLEDGRVKAEIARKQKILSAKYEITQERVLKEYAKIAFANMDDFSKWNGSCSVLKNSDEIKRYKKAAVSEITQTTNSRGESSIKLKLHPKTPALDSISRHLGMFIDRKEISGPGGKPIKVDSSEPVDLSMLSDEQLSQYENLTKIVMEARLNKESKDNK